MPDTDLSHIQMPPHSKEAEQSVIGGLMLSTKKIDEIFLMVNAEDFYLSDHRTIFSAIKKCYERDMDIDPVAIAEYLKVPTMFDMPTISYLLQLYSETPSAENILTYAKVVSERSKKRKLIRAGNTIADMGYHSDEKFDDILSEAVSLFDDFSDHQKKKTLHDHITNFMDNLEKKSQNPGVTGLRTGFHTFDERCNGLQGGDLYIVGGRPGMGKTTWALNVISHVLNQGKKVHGFSLEMPADRWIEKQCSAIAEVDYNALQRGKLADNDWAKLAAALSELDKAKFVVDDDAGQTIEEICLKIKSENNKEKTDLVVIDYLQLILGRGFNKTEQVGDVSTSLKRLAKQINTPIIALCQLNREVERRPNKRPMTSDLRDSGSLEQDADLIMFLYRDKQYHSDKYSDGDPAEFITSKTR